MVGGVVAALEHAGLRKGKPHALSPESGVMHKRSPAHMGWVQGNAPIVWRIPVTLFGRMDSISVGVAGRRLARNNKDHRRYRRCRIERAEAA